LPSKKSYLVVIANIVKPKVAAKVADALSSIEAAVKGLQA